MFLVSQKILWLRSQRGMLSSNPPHSILSAFLCDGIICYDELTWWLDRDVEIFAFSLLFSKFVFAWSSLWRDAGWVSCTSLIRIQKWKSPCLPKDNGSTRKGTLFKKKGPPKTISPSLVNFPDQSMQENRPSKECEFCNNLLNNSWSVRVVKVL